MISLHSLVFQFEQSASITFRTELNVDIFMRIRKQWKKFPTKLTFRQLVPELQPEKINCKALDFTAMC